MTAPTTKVLYGDAWTLASTLDPGSIDTIVTSPPYWGLRDYGHEGQFGLEATPEEYVGRLVELFRLLRPALKGCGTVWLNLGDSYNNRAKVRNTSHQPALNNFADDVWADRAARGGCRMSIANGDLKEKDLVGIPWMVAFALRADGWYLRSDIIWCLSGGTWLYVRTQKGDMPMTVKDMARLDPATVQLWNGESWTQLLGMSKSDRGGDEIELVLRSGERISCTPTHRFPTQRGLVAAGEIKMGDVLVSTLLPQPDSTRDCALDEDAAWLAGLYLAEGSRSGSAIQISGHVKETERWERVQRIARKYGGSATMTESGKSQAIRVYGRVLHSIIDELVAGRTAKNKCFSPAVWRYSNTFLAAMVDGYLVGDGHDDGARWRLGFCRNYNLERDLRTACARLGYTLTLNLSNVRYRGRRVATFRGEIRKTRSGHHNEKNRSEVVAVRQARCRQVYSLGVADDPHVFALASGVLTHNSKPNPMPESVTDRPTKAHEYLFLLSKSERYYFDQEAVREPATNGELFHGGYDKPGILRGTATRNGRVRPSVARGGFDGKNHAPGKEAFRAVTDTRNIRTVWTIATQPYPGAHFAVFPPKLIEPCIKAGTSERGVCPECGKAWERVVERGELVDQARNPGQDAHLTPQGYLRAGKSRCGVNAWREDRGWVATCTHTTEPIPATVLDPFLGSGTTAETARRLGRSCVGFELNEDYRPLIDERLQQGVLC